MHINVNQQRALEHLEKMSSRKMKLRSNFDEKNYVVGDLLTVEAQINKQNKALLNYLPNMYILLKYFINKTYRLPIALIELSESIKVVI